MPEIELKKIHHNRFNPRVEFRSQALAELTKSIRQVGLVEPIIVRPKGRGNFEVVVGERRYRAAQKAGLKKVPAIVKRYDDADVMRLTLVENIQREDLSAVEKARVCAQLREGFPATYPTWSHLAASIGIDEHTLQSWLQTLALPKQVQKLVAAREVERVPKGKIDYQTAVRIARTVKRPKKQIEIAREFAQRRVSWRAARQVLKQVVKRPNKPVSSVMREVIEEAALYLPFSKVHADAIVAGKKTQTSRKSKDPRLLPGAIVRAQVTHFADLEVVDVRRKRLGQFDETDAKAEGGYTLNEFKRIWKRLHGSWNRDEAVYVIRFRLLKAVGKAT
ncbi:ParB/RepB/Spo0J family partition protein [Acidobacteriia bacterium AH_259_A11_L15]|nr:ParB/RepB/Spo0J family partition protein [Acidobacteriia bacterium AH_259_A11_L15]